MGEHTIDQFKAEVLTGQTEFAQFLDSLRGDKPALTLELCRWVISSLGMGNHARLVKYAFHYLAHQRDIGSLEKLVNLKSCWENTYYNEYEYLMALLVNAQNGANCNCNVYQESSYNVAPFQADLEQISTEQSAPSEYIQTTTFHVRCKICNRHWAVEDSYHYPHSHWRLTSV
jgi:hypothetical protein